MVNYDTRRKEVFVWASPLLLDAPVTLLRALKLHVHSLSATVFSD